MIQTSIHDILETCSENARYNVVVKTLGTLAKGYNRYIVQWGVIGDNTGLIRFTVWPNYNGPTIEAIKTYSIQGAKFRINNRTPNLIFDGGTTVTEITDEITIAPQDPIEFDFNLPDLIVRVRGICLAINESVPITVKQKGWIGNIEGFKMPFTIFCSSDHTLLEPGRIYDIFFASVEEFGARRELYLDCAEIVEISSDQYPVDILTPFIEIDIQMPNACSKKICPHFFSTAHEVSGLTLDDIQSQIRTPLLNARENYSMRTDVNYSDRTNQLAYVFGYFPYYIEPIRDTLNTLEKQHLDLVLRNNMKINFYGCGPAPELLGFVRYLTEEYPQITDIQASFFDMYKWDPWRHCVVNNISREYWDGNIRIVEEPEVDLLQLPPETIADADIHCIQNVCSDLARTLNPARVAYWLRSIYAASKPNSLIIVLDVQYSYIRTQIFEPARDMIRADDNTSIINCPTSYSRASLDFIPSGIDLPINRQFTGYRYMTIVKKV